MQCPLLPTHCKLGLGTYKYDNNTNTGSQQKTVESWETSKPSYSHFNEHNHGLAGQSNRS